MDIQSASAADDTMTIPSIENSIFPPIDEFANDLETKLGRANGNVYYRRPGVEGLHDGQIMVRLKKKRFIIIDYSIVPTANDIATASNLSSVMIPSGAGKQKCVSPECTKVGVPVMLFDSDPEQPVSLYLRSGLCFTCQRLLNEKRRTQRKRKGDTTTDTNNINSNSSPSHASHQYQIDGKLPGITESYPCEKRFRLNGEILDLNPDAIIINGPLDDTKHHGPGYEYTEIGSDLQKITQEVSNETLELTNTIASLSEIPHSSSAQNAHILSMYEKTFVSLSKGIFLLNQWKISWDTAVSSHYDEDVIPVHVHEPEQDVAAGRGGGGGVGGVNDDVVASAAAVAAAQSIVSAAEVAAVGHGHGDDEDKEPEVFSV